MSHRILDVTESGDRLKLWRSLSRAAPTVPGQPVHGEVLQSMAIRLGHIPSPITFNMVYGPKRVFLFWRNRQLGGKAFHDNQVVT